MIKRIINSAIFNSWFSNLVILFSSLIAIPIVITQLTTEEANVWLVFFSVIALGQGILFGFNGTFVRFIAYSYSGISIDKFHLIKNKTECSFSDEFVRVDFERIYRLMRFIYLILAFLFLFLMLIIGYFSLSGPINSLSNPNDGWIAWSIVVLSSGMILALGFYRVLLEGINQVALVQRILGIVNLIGLLFILYVLLFTPSLFSIVLVYQLVAIMAAIVVSYFGAIHLKRMGITSNKLEFESELFSLVWESAWKTGVTTVIAGAIKHVSAILVAQWFSPGQSASYLFTKRLFDVIENFTTTTFQARVPIIAKYRGRGDFKVLIPFLKQTQWYAYSVFLVSYIILLFFGSDILKHIGSNVEIGSFWLIVLFSFATFLSRWGGMTLMISNQSNHVVEHINALIVGGVFFVVSFLLFEYMGVNVFPFALVCGLLFSVPVLAKQAYPTIQTSLKSYEKGVMFPALLILTFINVIYYLVSK